MRTAAVTTGMIVTGALAGLAGCAQETGKPAAANAPAPVYLGATAEPMGADLVQVKMSMKGVTGPEQIDAYSSCVASGYALKSNAGFVRHVRTLTDKEGGVWRADAVYSVTADLPRGVQTIDAQTMVADCADRGIPTGKS